MSEAPPRNLFSTMKDHSADPVEAESFSLGKAP